MPERMIKVIDRQISTDSTCRLHYDECQGGGPGFWVLVIPGVLSGATPYFNERDPVFHMDGSTMSLAQELAA